MPLCPICPQQPMVQVEEDEVVAYSCPTCHGTWISAAALQRRERIETDPSQPHMPLPPLTDLAETVTRSNSTTPLNCPDCRRAMTKERFDPRIPVQVDRCESCAHIWLDAGEQGLLLSLYQELATSQPHPDRQQNLDRLQQLRSGSTASYSSFDSTITSSTDDTGMNLALNIGSAVITILLDLFLSSGRSHYHRW